MNIENINCGHVKDNETCVRLNLVDTSSRHLRFEFCEECARTIEYQFRNEIYQTYGPETLSNIPKGMIKWVN